MGKIFLEHPGGDGILFSCRRCETVLSNDTERISEYFRGATGRAYLFRKVVNITVGPIQDRELITGRHWVRDVSCKKCSLQIGWMYEFAAEELQQYKEAKTVLERALLVESVGIDEI